FALRVGSLDGWGAYTGQIYIGSIEKIKKLWVNFLFRHTFVSFICFFLFIFYLLYFILRRKEKYYLWFAGLNLCIGCFIFGYNGLSLYLFDVYWSYVLFTFIGGTAMYLMTINFLHSFLNKKKGFFIRIIEALYIFFLISLLVEFFLSGHIYYFIKYLYQLVMLLFNFSVLYLLILNIKEILNKTPYSVHIFFGIFIQVISFVYSTFAYVGITNLDPLTGEGYLATVFAFAIIMAQRSANTHQELETAHIQLLTLDKLKDEFLANTSHELRTPLNGIIGLAESIIGNASEKISFETQKTLHLIVSSGKRLANLVNDILDFSQMKTNDLQIQHKAVSLKTLTDLVIIISKPLVNKKNLQLINAVPEDFPAVEGDENRIQQILINLVGNAIKFTETGLIKISANDLGEMIEVSVTDTGIGIPKDQLDHIFESFQQADGSASRAYGGTGLGLTVTKQLVELHGGEIKVNSEKNLGSTFTFTLPKSNMDPATITLVEEQVSKIHTTSKFIQELDTLPNNIEKKKAETASSENSTAKILIVDDEPVNLTVLHYQLIQNEYQVIESTNGQEALETIERDLPDLVILDIMMPRLTGYDVCKILREKYNQTELPIILLTAKNRIDDLITGFITGANDYITKPTVKSELLARVKNQLAIKEITSQIKELNLELENKVAERTRELSEKNKQITDSIKYASTIQNSILPHIENLQHYLSDHFIIWQPKDIVGGDYYWFHRVDDNRALLALIDCTGHGVPGALMCMTSYSILNNVIQHYNHENPAQILQVLNRILKNSLRQNSSNKLIDDGLDMGMCLVDKAEKKIIYAGAKTLLYHCFNHEIEVVKGDKQSIGYQKSNEDYQYTNHEIKIQDGSKFYLASDGIYEQIGGERELPFGKKKWQNLLQQIYSHNMQIQEQNILTEWNSYRENHPQLDDITVFGFKV
ncbi:MAG: ATP-binding protein, partial [Spirochaetes bacterium]|nr:ATP-binding protein [Spirochaetota bacterium]